MSFYGMIPHISSSTKRNNHNKNQLNVNKLANENMNFENKNNTIYEDSNKKRFFTNGITSFFENILFDKMIKRFYNPVKENI